ncbi:hypothetical protein Back2_19620 [Nocardioides baekrokdamisoli]|uniref:Glycosyltransferase 61 catalytic domain-containing protein n=1 Tax=Nocardioides baekrokdamisoli TaxID=1804624 RepID=A0A3G9INR1_9ACTN|nr:hypothetical protein Back2_19620 [Nocardioides baekrokdamisoli]
MYRRLSLLIGALGRIAGPLVGERRLPRRAYASAAEAAAAEPSATTFHPGPAVAVVERSAVHGIRRDHWAFDVARHRQFPALNTLEIAGGIVVGDLGAVITPGGGIEMAASEYWDMRSWHEHPINFAGRLPEITDVEGSVAVLAARGGGANYYHFLLDVLPRIGVLEQSFGDKADRWFLPQSTRYHRELVRLGGWDSNELINSSIAGAVRAERLLVPSLPNDNEITPPWVVEWLRDRFLTGDTDARASRIYVTRGTAKNTRRYDQEAEIWPELERRGFVRVDPGTLSVREQIDTFAAADVVIGVHGAALTNLVWSPAGVRVLHLMGPTFVKHCFQSLVDNVSGSQYRYLIGDGPAVPPGGSMTGLMSDISIDPAVLLAELDQLL